MFDRIYRVQIPARVGPMTKGPDVGHLGGEARTNPISGFARDASIHPLMQSTETVYKALYFGTTGSTNCVGGQLGTDLWASTLASSFRVSATGR
jgi:hypothetical protein